MVNIIFNLSGNSELNDKIKQLERTVPNYQELILQILKIINEFITSEKDAKIPSSFSFEEMITELITLYSRKFELFNSTSLYFVKIIFQREIYSLYRELRYYNGEKCKNEEENKLMSEMRQKTYRLIYNFWRFLEICRDTSIIENGNKGTHKNKNGKKIFSFKKTVLEKLHEINDLRFVNYLTENANIIREISPLSNNELYNSMIMVDKEFEGETRKINWYNEFMNYKCETLENRILELEKIIKCFES